MSSERVATIWGCRLLMLALHETQARIVPRTRCHFFLGRNHLFKSRAWQNLRQYCHRKCSRRQGWDEQTGVGIYCGCGGWTMKETMGNDGFLRGNTGMPCFAFCFRCWPVFVAQIWYSIIFVQINKSIKYAYKRCKFSICSFQNDRELHTPATVPRDPVVFHVSRDVWAPQDIAIMKQMHKHEARPRVQLFEVDWLFSQLAKCQYDWLIYTIIFAYWDQPRLQIQVGLSQKGGDLFLAFRF